MACSQSTGDYSGNNTFPTPSAPPTTMPVFAVTQPVTPHPIRTPPPCLIVTAEKALNLRYEPSPDTAILAWLYNGEQITGLAYGGGWWEIITQDGRHGFVKADYVTHCP